MKHKTIYFSKEIEKKLESTSKKQNSETISGTYIRNSYYKKNYSLVPKDIKKENTNQKDTDANLIDFINHNKIRNSQLLNGLSKNHVATLNMMKNLNTKFKDINDLKNKIGFTDHEITILKNNFSDVLKKEEEIPIKKIKKEEIKDKKPKTPDYTKNITEKNTKKNSANKHVRINFNTCSKQEMISLKIFSLYQINQIMIFREKGTLFNSFGDFKDYLKFNDNIINKMKSRVIIIPSSNINITKKNTKTTKFTESTKSKNSTNIRKIKVNFNTCKRSNLDKFHALSSENIDKIILLRKNNIEFNSFDDLEYKAELSRNTIEQLKKFIELVPNKKSNKTMDSEENIEKIDELLNKKPMEKQDKPNNIIKEKRPLIDINTADEETLTELPSFNLIKAKKIIELRQQKIFIQSYEDLERKLSLKPYQIEQIKSSTKISKQKPVRGRIIDL